MRIKKVVDIIFFVLGILVLVVLGVFAAYLVAMID